MSTTSSRTPAKPGSSRAKCAQRL